MIQARLGSLWKRIMFYKYLMILTLAFNVFTALSGAICSYLVWNGAFELSSQIAKQETETQKLTEFESMLLTVPQINEKKKISRQQALTEIQAWEKLRARAESLNFAAYDQLPPDYLFNGMAAQSWLSQLQMELDQRRQTNSQSLLKMAKREDQLSSALMWLGSLTLIFGIAIPMIVFSLLAKAMRQAQKALSEAARDIVRSWSKALDKHGDDPFKNPHFWMEVLLIFGEQMGHHSRHPAFALTSELSYLVREELHKSGKEAA